MKGKISLAAASPSELFMCACTVSDISLTVTTRPNAARYFRLQVTIFSIFTQQMMFNIRAASLKNTSGVENNELTDLTTFAPQASVIAFNRMEFTDSINESYSD